MVDKDELCNWYDQKIIPKSSYIKLALLLYSGQELEDLFKGDCIVVDQAFTSHFIENCSKISDPTAGERGLIISENEIRKAITEIVSDAKITCDAVIFKMNEENNCKQLELIDNNAIKTA